MKKNEFIISMADFHLLITDWFRLNCRDLPWRKKKLPYHIWLSEIILQQTRVDQGLSYFNKFIENYPDIQALAKASEQSVLRDWQGLGYYSRARNLHATAKIIVEKHNASFPNSFSAILALKGIGDYTASAIASISFDLPHAVVDGNVYRVLSRYFDIDLPIDTNEGIKHFKSLAQSLLGNKNHGEHNQALMEIGALVCKPQNPDCNNCPLKDSCAVVGSDKISLRPVKSKKLKVRNRYFHYLIYCQDEKILLQQRTEKDIWQQLYQFPLIEVIPELNSELSAYTAKARVVSKEIIHVLSHQKIITTFYHFSEFPEKIDDSWVAVSLEKLDDYPIPRLIELYLENNKLIH
ncbi:MAG: A/G-specific adenine glycosylase [Bacteroidota bacterium]